MSEDDVAFCILMFCIKAVYSSVGGIHPLILGSIPILFSGMTRSTSEAAHEKQ